MAIYTLRVYDNKTKHEQIVKIEESGELKSKVDITTLDMFVLKNAKYGLDNTTMLPDEKAGKANFIRFLNDSLNTEQPRIKERISEDSIIYIAYKHKGNKYLEPVYKNDFLYNIATEFESFRKEYNIYKENHPEVKGEALEEYRKSKFAKVTKEPFLSHWIDLFYNDLDRATFVHEINDDKKYLNSSSKSNGEKIVLKDLVCNLSRYLVILKRENELEQKEISETVSYLKNEIDKNFFTRYKIIRGAVIFRDNFWNKKSIINNNKERSVPMIEESVGSMDVKRAMRLYDNKKIKKVSVEEDNTHHYDNKKIKEDSIEENNTLHYVRNNFNSEMVYFDRTDELEYERRAKEREKQEYKEWLNSNKVKKR